MGQLSLASHSQVVSAVTAVSLVVELISWVAEVASAVAEKVAEEGAQEVEGLYGVVWQTVASVMPDPCQVMVSAKLWKLWRRLA